MILETTDICSKLDLELVTFVSNIITIIKILVPVILVVFGMLDLGKGVIAGKEDEIKKGQRNFIKRLIAGVIVFFIVSITQLTMAVIDRESDGEIWNCANLIMNGKTENIKTEEQLRNEIIEDCCNKVSGTLTTEGSYTCRTENEKQAEAYSKCFNAEIRND